MGELALSLKRRGSDKLRRVEGVVFIIKVWTFVLFEICIQSPLDSIECSPVFLTTQYLYVQLDKWRSVFRVI